MTMKEVYTVQDGGDRVALMVPVSLPLPNYGLQACPAQYDLS